MKDRRARWSLVALLLVAGAASIPFLHAPPFLDDIDEAEYLQHVTTVGGLLRCDCYGLFRPVKNLVFYGVMHLTPDTPVVRHGLSVALFLAVIALSFVLFRRLLRHERWALVATAIYALAPSQWSAVAWFSTVNILVMVTGCWLALWAYDEAREQERARPRAAAGWRLAAAAWYLLALFSYESAVAFPALLLVWDGCRRRALWTRRSLAHYAAFGGLTLAYLAVRALAGGHVQISGENMQPGITPLQLSATSGWFIWDHLSCWLWPFGRQSLNGSFLWGPAVVWRRLLPGWLALAALAGLVWRARRRLPLAAWGGAWFFIAFLPTSNLLPLRNGPLAEYYLMLPSLGLALAVTAVLCAAVSRAQTAPTAGRRGLWAGAAGLLLLWWLAAAATGFGWARAWGSEEEIFRRTQQARPEDFPSAVNLARIEMLTGRLAAADQLLQRAQAEAPWSVQCWRVLGDLRLRQNHPAAAQDCFETAARLWPGDAYPHLALGYLFEGQSNGLPRAEAEYRQVLSFPWSGYSVTAALNLSRLLATHGQPAAARRILEAALQQAPASAKLHYNAALACRQAGDAAAAARHFQVYQELQRRAARPPGR